MSEHSVLLAPLPACLHRHGPKTKHRKLNKEYFVCSPLPPQHHKKIYLVCVVHLRIVKAPVQDAKLKKGVFDFIICVACLDQYPSYFFKTI